MEQITDDTQTVVVTGEAELEMARIIRASLIPIADVLENISTGDFDVRASAREIRACVLAVVGALERRYQIPSKKARNKP